MNIFFLSFFAVGSFGWSNFAFIGSDDAIACVPFAVVKEFCLGCATPIRMLVFKTFQFIPIFTGRLVLRYIYLRVGWG